jgi:hypothetical protein
MLAGSHNRSNNVSWDRCYSIFFKSLEKYLESTAHTCIATGHRLLLGQRRESIDEPCQIVAMRRLQRLKHGIRNEDEKRRIDEIVIDMQLLYLLDPNRRSCHHEATREPGCDPHDYDKTVFGHLASQSHTRGRGRRHSELRWSLQLEKVEIFRW